MATSYVNVGLIAAVRGFVFSAAAAAILAATAMMLFCAIGGADGCKVGLDLWTLIAFLAWALFLGMFAAIGVACLGLASIILAKSGGERAWVYVSLGFVLGSLLTLLIPGPREQFVDPEFYLAMALLGGLPGVIGGWVWWVSYRRARTRWLPGGPV